MKYISKNYLQEKWDSLKWDMEKCILVDDTDDGSVSEETLNRCKWNIKDKILSICKEMGIDL